MSGCWATELPLVWRYSRSGFSRLWLLEEGRTFYTSFTKYRIADVEGNPKIIQRTLDSRTLVVSNRNEIMKETTLLNLLRSSTVGLLKLDHDL